MNLLNEYIDEMMTEINGKIIPGNIKKGVTIFNTEGNLDAMDTSDATAVAKDIINGKTAYVNGEKITGNIQERTAEQTPMKTVATTITENNDRNRFGMSGVPTALQTYAFRPNAKVEVEADKDEVANAIGLTPEKLVKGNTILGVEGTAEGGATTVDGAKIFTSIESMNADTSAKKDDLAVVYGKEIEPVLAGTSTQNVIFPTEVVLSEAVTSSLSDSFHEGRLDFRVDISSSSFSFSMMNMNDYTSVDISYNSSDGITYTRISEEDFINFGTSVTFPTDMNVVFSNFIHRESDNKFKGLFIYDLEKQNKDLFNAYIGKLQTDTTSFNHYELKNNDFITQAKDIVSSDSKASYFYGIIKVIELTDDNSPAKIQCFYSGNTIICDDNNTYIGGGNGSSSILWTVDLVNKTYTKKSGIQTETVTVGGASKMVWKGSVMQDTDIWFYCSSTNTYPSQKTFDYYAASATTAISNPIIYNYVTYAGYRYADTQFTLTDSTQLLPNVIGYGNNGEVVGDGSIYNNLDPIEMRKITGIDVKNHSVVVSSNRGSQYSTIDDVTNGLVAKFNVLAHITDIDNDTSYSSYIKRVSRCGDKLLIIYRDTAKHTKAALVYNSEIIKTFDLSTSSSVPYYSIYRDGVVYMMVIESNKTLKVTRYDSMADTTTTYSTTLAYTSATSFVFGYGFTNNSVCVAIECVKAGLVIYSLGVSSVTKLYNTSSSYEQYATVANCNNVNYNGYLYFEYGTTKTAITVIAINNSTNAVSTFTVSGTQTSAYGCEGMFATDTTKSKLYLIAGDDGVVYEINGTTKTSTGLTGYSTFAASNQTSSNHLDYMIDVSSNTFEYTNYGYREILHSSKASTSYDLTIRYSTSSMGTNLYPSDKVEGLTITTYPNNSNNRVEHLYYSYDSNGEVSIYDCTIYPGKGFVEGSDYWDIESTHTKFILHDILEPDYTGTINPTEYSTAIDTANEILGDTTE